MIATPPPVLNLRFMKTISNPFGTRLEIVTLSSFFTQVSVMKTKSAFFSTIKSLTSVYLLLHD